MFLRIGNTLVLLVFVNALLSSCVFISTTEYGEYYVSPDGDDVTGDGSRMRPWANIQHAINQTRIRPEGMIPRINVDPGDYPNRLWIRDTVFIKGAGSEFVTIRSLSLGREPVIEIEGPGSVRLEGLTVDGWFGQHRGIRVRRAGLRTEDIVVYKPGVYGIELVESGLFDIRRTRIDTDGNNRADLGIKIEDSNGSLVEFYGGDHIDHIVNITNSTVIIRDAVLVGTDLWYADGIRMHSPSNVEIHDSMITRPADAEVPGPGDVHNPPYAGIEIAFANERRKRVLVRNTRVEGFNTGIGINMIGNRLLVEGSTMSGNRSEGALTFARPGRAAAVVDFGGGPLGSAGNNVFGLAEPVAFRNNASYDVDARGNDWGVPAARIHERIHDVVDDPALGRVRF